MESFNNHVEVVGHCGGSLGTHPALITYMLKNNVYADKDKALEASEEAYQAISFLSD